MLDDDLRGAFLTSDLTDRQRADLIAAGDEVPFVDGERLFVEGQPADHLWILLEGVIELSRRSKGEVFVVATMTTPGQWAGGMRAWGTSDDHSGYRATGMGTVAGRMLRVPSEELGRLVGEWFAFGKHMTVGIYQTVRAIEAEARQRDSLVALGTLAAGLAHEINNPAAASLRAVTALRATCDAMLTSLTTLAVQSISGDQFVALDQLRIDAARAAAPVGSTLARSDREDRLGTWLERHDVRDPWRLAPVLAGSGIDEEWCERVLAAVGPGAIEGAFRWTASNLDATALLDDLEDATTRISGLVADVRSYSQMDRASLQRVDLRDGIRSTLSMLGHKLGGIEVVTSFADDLPEMDAYAGELNQVWTNLIDNAIDAMEGSGTLHITTRLAGPDAVVEVADTGHGMTPDVQARVFEPFFTTKDVGRGTGLGLDISRRVVFDRHRGDISFTSSPVGTTARVRIPLAR